MQRPPSTRTSFNSNFLVPIFSQHAHFFPHYNLTFPSSFNMLSTLSVLIHVGTINFILDSANKAQTLYISPAATDTTLNYQPSISSSQVLFFPPPFFYFIFDNLYSILLFLLMIFYTIKTIGKCSFVYVFNWQVENPILVYVFNLLSWISVFFFF